MIKVGSDCSGIGAFNQSLMRLGKEHDVVFSCDFDYYARLSYIANYGTEEDLKLAKTKLHKKYADGVKKIALLDHKPSQKQIQFLAEANEFAKKFSFYFPFNMYQREIPKDPLDVYVSTVPCQSFSIAGKRCGELDKRGILFYNSLEFIRENNPRFFIFENVKGLLSHDKDPKHPKNPIGRTFQKWIQYLGGKSIDGNMVIMPDDNAVPYHIYIKVLNATDFGVPQNRERVFIVGIRDDEDNNFSWPSTFPLTKRLIDVLEVEVEEKYFLSDKMINYLITRKDNFNGGKINYKGENDIASCINSSSKSIDISDNIIKTKSRVQEFLSPSSPSSPTITANYAKQSTDIPYLKVKSATKKGFEEAGPEDSIDLQFPDSKTRRGRVGKGVAQTLDTSCNQGIIQLNNSVESGGVQPYKQNRVFDSNSISPVLDSECGRPHYLLDFRVRRLTPRECLRLMDFPEEYKIVVSDTQAYKQAGNSIVVSVLFNTLKNFSL